MNDRAAVCGFLQEFSSRRLVRPDKVAAAVACVVAPDEAGELSFLLTRRSTTLRLHRGQYALPGGRVDVGETAEQAARRELHEELGVDLCGASVLGLLDDYATRSGYLITPVVLWSDVTPLLEPAPDEVAQVYRIRFEELDHPQMPRLHRIDESASPVISVPVRGDFVHAPTAAVVYQLWSMIWRGEGVRVADYEQPVFAWR